MSGAPHKNRRHRPRRQRGQAYLEYVLATLLVVGVLLSGGDDSALNQLLRGFQSFYGAYGFALSTP
jgi:L-lysine 2,3-aminomutase